MPWLLAAGKWLLRLVGGWLPLGNKPFGEWLGKILWAVGIAVAVYLVIQWLSPKTNAIKTGSQKAESIINVYHTETVRPTVGCANLRVMEYYAKKENQEK